MDILSAKFTPEDYEFALIALLLAALISFYVFVRNWKRLRIIEDTPTARLRSAHQGYIELEGKGQFMDDQPIYAPLSNHPCLWYRSQIEQQETFTENGRTQTRWHVVYKNISNHRFKLTDGANSCYVDPDDAEVNGNEKLVWYGNTEWPTKTQILESQSIVHAMTNSYRYSECLILPGQPLYVLGQFKTWSAAAQQSVRDVMIHLINDWKQDQPALRKRFDSNKDGNIDQQEWEVARQQARSEAQQIHDQLALEPDENIITRPDNSEHPFIISVYPQTLLIRKYRHTAFLALTGCVLSIGIIAWLVNAHG
ncbi:MAG: E3 ubiquitin--protein ligase [Nitrosomonas sp.]|nr:E3 ubiquitin--protein ligase [Nitrosomonas sp.]MBP6075855.1 E3 ubiquitin--protein ligase [Nitrosomonas sp.]